MNLAAWLAQFGVLRLALLGLAVAVSVLATDPGTPLLLQGWALIDSLVLPAAAPLVLFVLLFDMLMSLVRLADAAPSERAQWKRILLAEGLAGVLILICWSPFFAAVLEPLKG